MVLKKVYYSGTDIGVLFIYILLIFLFSLFFGYQYLINLCYVSELDYVNILYLPRIISDVQEEFL